MPALPVIAQTIEDALTPIHDGIMLAVPREVAGVPMEATRALIRRGVRNLHLVTLPTSSLQADLLIEEPPKSTQPRHLVPQIGPRTDDCWLVPELARGGEHSWVTATTRMAIVPL